MKNNRIQLFPGLSLFLCFCLLMGSGRLAVRFGGGTPLLAAAETISFLLPLGLVLFSMRDQKRFRNRLRLRSLSKDAILLAVELGVTAAVLSLFLNFLIFRLAGFAGADLSAIALDVPQSGMGMAARLLVIVLLSAVVEELYLRGALFAVQEESAGTSACLLFSGLIFAMLHGSLMNFAGPLLAGIAFAYLTYVFNSVWPAILMPHLAFGTTLQGSICWYFCCLLIFPCVRWKKCWHGRKFRILKKVPDGMICGCWYAIQEQQRSCWHLRQIWY